MPQWMNGKYCHAANYSCLQEVRPEGDQKIVQYSEYGAWHTSRMCVSSSLTTLDGLSTPPLVVACRNFPRIGTYCCSMAKSAWFAESNKLFLAWQNLLHNFKTAWFSHVWKIPRAGLHLASSEKNWRYCGGDILSCSFLRDFINAVRLGMSLLVSWHSSLNSASDNCFRQEICLRSLETPAYLRSREWARVFKTRTCSLCSQWQQTAEV